MRSLGKLILHNAGLKVLALAIAFSLWTAYASQPIVEAGFDVPIAFAGLSKGLAMSTNAPNSMHMVIRGPADVLRSVHPADLRFTVDLSQVGPGTAVVHPSPQMANVPYGTHVVALTPATFRVSCAATSATLSR